MLIDAIDHPEPTSAAFVIDLLGRHFREPKAVSPLMNRLARNPDSMDVTAAAATALGQIGDRRAVPALAAVLLDNGRPLPARLAAAEALAMLGGDEARRAMRLALDMPGLPRLLGRVIESELARWSEA